MGFRRFWFSGRGKARERTTTLLYGTRWRGANITSMRVDKAFIKSMLQGRQLAPFGFDVGIADAVDHRDGRKERQDPETRRHYTPTVA